MDIDKERRILKIIWLDVETFVLWDKYLEIIHNDKISDNEADRQASRVRKEIDHFEQKILDISYGIRYTDIVQVKEKYNLEATGMIYGILDKGG